LQREGLVAALRSRLEVVEERVGMETVLDVDGYRRCGPEIEEGLYRIAQEALNNALKHARANSVKVSLQQAESRVMLVVLDDGTGFDLRIARRAGGFGLRGMEERANRLGGRLLVQSSPGKGTEIRVEICQ
jgi:signal transduction histidine kinase